MSDEILVRKALAVWQESGETQEHVGHLAEEALYRLAVPGGLDKAAVEELEHLSLCPACQTEWAAWLDSFEIVNTTDEHVDENDTVLGFGLLKAAAASLFSEPVCLESSCGRFELSVFPDMDKPERAMVVLEVKAGGRNLDGRYCVVRDGSGAVICKGVLEDGRCAGRIAELSLLDLKTWTVLVSAD